MYLKVQYIIACILTVFVCSNSFSQETFTLTTYYPAPFGVYQRLVTQTLGVGDNNGSGTVDANDAPNPTVVNQEGDVWIAGDLGIGTNAPVAKLHIRENALTANNRQPGIVLEDAPTSVGGSGFKYDMRMRTTSTGAVLLRHYFPIDSSEPNWGLFSQIDEDQNTYFYGNVSILKPAARPDPSRLGVGTSSPQAALDVAGDGILVPRTATVPSAINGMVYYNSNDNEFRFREDNTWKTLGGRNLHMAKMARRTAQSIPQGCCTKIALNREEFDYGGIANPGNGSFVIQKDGVYLITASWRCGGFTYSNSASGDSEMGTYIYINGSARGQSDSFVKGPKNETGYGLVQDTYRLNAGDVITMYVSHTAGGTRNTQTGLDNRPRMSVIQLR